jgi:hypothetical protein
VSSEEVANAGSQGEDLGQTEIALEEPSLTLARSPGMSHVQ